MTTCRCCAGKAHRDGFHINRNGRVQRFKCTRCGTKFSEERPLEGVRIETAKAAQVVHLLCEGMGVRGIARLTQLDKNTVLRVLTTAGEHCARLLDAKVRNVQAEQVEIDEAYSFVKTRPDNTEANDEEHGAFFLFLSLDRETKLIVNHLIGKRHGDTAREFLSDLKARVATRFQLSSDGWKAYNGCWTGGAVRGVFGDDIDYGSEVKQFGPLVSRISSPERVSRKFNPVIVKWVKRTPHIGNPDKDQINTSRVERLNLTVRTFNKRFVRCTLGYSKTLENHKASAAMFTAFYNFCRVHSAHGKTPAQKAGLTDHAWTVKELLAELT